MDTITRISRACPVCGSDHATPLEQFSRMGWTTVRCDACEFVYLNEAPRYEDLSETLAWTQQFQKEKKRRKEKAPLVAWIDEKTRWRLHIARDNEWDYILDRVPEGGNVLDVGCGTKDNLPAAITPFGIEIEKAAAETANAAMSARGGKVVHAPALEGMALFEDNFFHGMVMRSYLEHEMKPREVLEAALSKLRPGGTIYVKVPNFGTINRMVRGVDWCGFRFPDHLNYFDVSGMQRLAESVGYTFELRNKVTRLTNDNMHVFLTRPR